MPEAAGRRARVREAWEMSPAPSVPAAWHCQQHPGAQLLRQLNPRWLTAPLALSSPSAWLPPPLLLDCLFNSLRQETNFIFRQFCCFGIQSTGVKKNTGAQRGRQQRRDVSKDRAQQWQKEGRNSCSLHPSCSQARLLSAAFSWTDERAGPTMPAKPHPETSVLKIRWINFTSSLIKGFPFSSSIGLQLAVLAMPVSALGQGIRSWHQPPNSKLKSGNLLQRLQKPIDQKYTHGWETKELSD